MKPKIIVTILFALFISACAATIETPTVTETPTLLAANTSTAIFTPTVTEIPAETPNYTLTPLACSQLISPENNLPLPKTGKITFAWSSFPSASLYKLEITPPFGQVIAFETDKTTRDQYIEAIWMGGSYQWQVSVLDKNKNYICSSNIFVFEKPEYTTPIPPAGSKITSGACHPEVIVSYGQGEPYADPPGSGWICQDAFGYDDCGNSFWQGRTCGGD